MPASRLAGLEKRLHQKIPAEENGSAWQCVPPEVLRDGWRLGNVAHWCGVWNGHRNQFTRLYILLYLYDIYQLGFISVLALLNGCWVLGSLASWPFFWPLKLVVIRGFKGPVSGLGDLIFGDQAGFLGGVRSPRWLVDRHAHQRRMAG